MRGDKIPAREAAQQSDERHHEHLAQTARAAAGWCVEETADACRGEAHRSEYDRLVEYELDLTLADEPEWMARTYWQSSKELADEAAQRIVEDDLNDGLDLDSTTCGGQRVLSFYSGHSIDYLTDEVAEGRESYYTGAVAAGEPPGRWYGRGAAKLGLSGLVDHEVIANLYGKFLDPRDGETVLGHRGYAYRSPEEVYQAALAKNPHASAEERERMRLRAGKESRSSVAFHDATFNVQKSVTVLHAAFEAQEVAARRAGNPDAEHAWAAHRKAVEDAIWAGNNAALDYLAEHAGYTRTGHHGGTAGRWTDAHDWTVASFFQHDNRNHDPHLHIHNAILNRVQGPDGKWRTLDWKVAEKVKPAAGAVGERVMFGRLISTLGVKVAMRPDGVSREIVGVDQRVMDLFSSRAQAIDPKTAALAEAFETRFGHPPNALQLYRLSRQATLATRPAKSHTGETREQRGDRWDRMVRGLDTLNAELRAEVDTGLGRVAWDALRHADRHQHGKVFDPEAVLQTAVAEVQGIRSRWTESDLIKAISNALPDHLGALDGTQVQELLHGLAAEAMARHCVKLTADAPGTATLPAGERLANGRSAQCRPATELFAAADHVRSERVLRGGAVQRGAAALSPELAEHVVTELAELGIELGADQAHAVRGVLTSGAQLESLVGPAGTGKTVVVGALAKAWQDPALWSGLRRRCIGLASAQIATDALAAQGLTACNVAHWLAAQRRLAAGNPTEEDRELALREGDLIVVDESSMANTPDLAAIGEYASAAGAKRLNTGDHRQLGAVGAGGAMSMVAAAGLAYELTEVRRFRAAWERDASLRLREGDPAALLEYRKHGRIIDGGTLTTTTDRAITGYLADLLRGRDTRLLVDTNEQAAQVSAQVRAELVALGKVAETGVSLGRQGTVAGVGDLVEARRLAWELAGYAGNRRGPVTRERYRVLAVGEDGALEVAHVLGAGPEGEELGDRLTLPPAYVAEDLALGYASTVHSVEGITVDTCHAVATARTSRAAQYVELTRGRDRNTVYVPTLAEHDDASAVLGGHLVAGYGRENAESERQDPLAVLGRSGDEDTEDRAALVEAETSAREMGSVQTAAERLAEVAERQAAARTAAMLDHLCDRDVLTETQRVALATDENTSTLAVVLRQAEIAGHDPLTVLTSAITERELGNARSIASVLDHRIRIGVDLDPRGDSHVDWVPQVADPAYQHHLHDLAAAADRRRDQLGRETAVDAPQWALEALGPVPVEPVEHAEWLQRAGIVAAHRELTGHSDQAMALPGAPPRGRVEEYASWRASWRALGRPEDVRAEREMDDGALRIRVRAMAREETWAPPYVARDLSGITQAAERARDEAALLALRAEHATNATEAVELAERAAAAERRAADLDQRTAHLEAADEARGEWYAHTAVTRELAERARLELAARDIDPDQLDHPVTAEEWLDAHRGDQADSEPHRTITDADIDTNELDYDIDLAVQDESVVSPDEATWDTEAATEAEPAAEAQPVAETQVPDVREIAGVEAPAKDNVEDWERVPALDETAEAIDRARVALAELDQREAWQAQRDAEDHAAQLAYWPVEEQIRMDEHEIEAEPVMEQP